jgi:hypothetical protein
MVITRFWDGLARFLAPQTLSTFVSGSGLVYGSLSEDSL